VDTFLFFFALPRVVIFLVGLAYMGAACWLPNGSYTSQSIVTITLSGPGGTMTETPVEGQIRTSKKDAEMSAAAKALKHVFHVAASLSLPFHRSYAM
jgi:hypothetical protein